MKTAILRAHNRTIIYALEPTADSTPPALRAFSGVWIGARDIQCAGAIFERVSDPNPVPVVWFNGVYPSAHAAGGAMPPLIIRAVGEFDGTKVAFDGRGTLFEFSLVNSQTMTAIITFQQRSVGTFRKQYSAARLGRNRDEACSRSVGLDPDPFQHGSLCECRRGRRLLDEADGRSFLIYAASMAGKPAKGNW